MNVQADSQVFTTLKPPRLAQCTVHNKDISVQRLIQSGKSSESVQCAITGPCLRMRHRPSA